jgi:hypothetical protein
MATLEDIIDSPENLEVKRALAVKMFLCNYQRIPPVWRGSLLVWKVPVRPTPGWARLGLILPGCRTWPLCLS